MEKDNLEIGMYLKKRYCVLKVLELGVLELHILQKIRIYSKM